MVSLISLLKEVYGGSPKAIIITGRTDINKSMFLNTIEPHVTSDVKIINQDDISQTIDAKRSFIYDTTGQSFKGTLGLVQAAQASGYKVMIITLYTSPIVSFLRNFSRGPKLSKNVILDDWAKVYKNIEDFSNIPNVEFLLVQSEMDKNEVNAVSAFERAFKGNELDEYFKEILQKDPDKFKSSFKKPESKIKSSEDLPDPEMLKVKEEKKKQSEDKFKAATDHLKDQLKEVEKYLKVLKPLNYKESIGHVKNFVKP